MKKYHLSLIILSCILISCATIKTDYKLADSVDPKLSDENPKTSLLLLGNLSDSLKVPLKSELIKLNTNDKATQTTAIVLGNNFSLDTKEASVSKKEVLKNDIKNFKVIFDNIANDFVFIPGQSEWKLGVDALNTVENEVDDEFGKDSFLPEKACPLTSTLINDQTIMVVVDSQWYLNDWNKFPKMNDDCEIKDREKFFAEFESLIKKNTDKTIIVAMHHPVLSNGNFGGQYSIGQHMTPLPVLGTIKNIAKKTGGFSEDNLQNPLYRSFRKRLITLAQYNDRVIFVSAHEENLQYISEYNIHQVISGSISNGRPSRLGHNGFFSSGENGYSKLDFYDDGSTYLSFYDLEGIEIYTKKIFDPFKKIEASNYRIPSSAETTASIYKEGDTDKSSFHKWFWGERYRDLYSTKVKAPAVDLDTLMGGVKVLRKGGGHQSKSLRVETKDGREFVMRALEKSAEAYLQALVSKEQFIIGRVKGSAPERVLKDFYTGSHPYAPFVVGDLADEIDIYHTNPFLCYIPKQEALGGFNEEFGDKLYMIEERVTDGHGGEKSFGFANKIIGTDDLIAKLASDEKYEVDLDMYVRARLFDMLLGDWDRHDDQWRWAEFKSVKEDKIVYRPVPRDRDQVFSKMGDGFLMGLATRAVPSLKLMEGFDAEIRNVKGFNSSPKTFALDMSLLPETTLEQWVKEANYIQNQLNKDNISKALDNFPDEINDSETRDWIINSLLSRKDNLVKTAEEYYEVLNKRSVIYGTDKDDYFKIEDLGDGLTKVSAYRIKGGERTDKFFEKTYSKEVTKEIWIYGLDDDDEFEVVGNKKTGPKLRLIGGLNNDIYDIDKRKKVHILFNS
ncbi:MAG: hypothetical protein AAGH46_07110 [Bacteroidota bacterium]